MIWFAIIEVSFVVLRKPWAAPFFLGVGCWSLVFREEGDGTWEMGDGTWEMGDGKWEMGDRR